MKTLSKIFKKTEKTRILFFMVTDAILITLSFYAAFIFRFGWQIPRQYFEGSIQTTIILALIFCLPIFFFSKLYHFTWAYVSTREMILLFCAVSLSFLMLGASFFILRDYYVLSGFPRSILLIGCFLVFFSTGFVRFAKKVYLNLKSFKNNKKNGGKRTLIVGAGDAGEQLLRSIRADKKNAFWPVGFVDDSQMKQNIIIHGLKVLGNIDDIPRVKKNVDVEEMIIAIPSASPKIIKKAIELGRTAGIKNIKILPSIIELIDGKTTIDSVRDIQVADLLRRDVVSVDNGGVETFIKNKIILITGAAGSIGSELSRQIIKLRPAKLLLLDREETGMFFLANELNENFPRQQIISVIADIRDKDKITEIFRQFRPNIVFHAAAYKHVPLMEENHGEAVKNNILGTKIVADAAYANNVDKFIFISTDKAINPTSIMGATKRIGEMICQALNQKDRTKFISVRFGNVLGSRGSVVPIFQNQIKRGGPIEITHPDMKRYFMITAEACLLVMQAAEMGSGGEVFVLDMGEPIKIVDLAREMVRLSGLEPDQDISLVFTKIRPGEKMFEEILTAEEGVTATKNKMIYVARLSSFEEKKFDEGLAGLKNLTSCSDSNKIKEALKFLVPNYRG